MKKLLRSALSISGLVLILTFQNCGDIGLHRIEYGTGEHASESPSLSGSFCHPENASDVSKYTLSEFYALNLTVRKFKDTPSIDQDMDGVLDRLQMNPMGSNTVAVSPMDSDQDGLPDFIEVLKGLNPTQADLYNDGIDLDGVNSIEEIQLGTDPSAADLDQSEISYTVNPLPGTTPGCGAGQKAYEFQVTRLPLMPTGAFTDSVNTVNPALSLSHGKNENVILLMAKMDSIDARVEPVFLIKIFRQSSLEPITNRFATKDFSIFSESYTSCENCRPANLNLTYNKIFTGFHHACAISTANKIYCWGDNSYGQLGDDSTQARYHPTAVANLTEDIETAALGDGHTCVLTKPAGNVYCWGRNFYGQLGNGQKMDSTKPVKVEIGAGLSANKLVAGAKHTCAALANGAINIQCWGQNYGESLPTAVMISSNGGPILSLSAGGARTCLSDSRKKVYCGSPTNVTPLPVNFYEIPAPNNMGGSKGGPLWSQITTNGNFLTGTVETTNPTGKIVCWADSGSGSVQNSPCAEMESSNPNSFSPYTLGIDHVQKIVMASNHSCALHRLISGDNAIDCWGNNSFGQTAQTLNPAQPLIFNPMSVNIPKPIDVAVAANYSCGIDVDRHIWCWGINDYGQLGNGNTLNPTSPQKVLGQ